MAKIQAYLDALTVADSADAGGIVRQACKDPEISRHDFLKLVIEVYGR